MIFKKLNLEEIKKIFEENMKKDFPADELKPFSVIKALYEKNAYSAIAMYDKDRLAAYALFTDRGKESKIHLLDYYAVAENRGMGYGSAFMNYLKSIRKNIIAEVENPEFSHNEDDRANRKRRISFYIKNGFEMTAKKCKYYGVEYNIMRFGKCSEEEMKKELDILYKNIFGEAYNKELEWHN